MKNTLSGPESEFVQQTNNFIYNSVQAIVNSVAARNSGVSWFDGPAGRVSVKQVEENENILLERVCQLANIQA